MTFKEIDMLVKEITHNRQYLEYLSIQTKQIYNLDDEYTYKEFEVILQNTDSITHDRFYFHSGKGKTKEDAILNVLDDLKKWFYSCREKI